MRTHTPLIRAALLSALALAGSVVRTPPVANAQARATSPCVTPTTACERWITYGKGPARSMVYATHTLTTRNAGLTRAFILIHGASRNADHYFETATAAGFLAGALGNTIIIAPHIIATPDKPQANEVLWPSNGINWRGGGFATSDPTITSFDFIDELVKQLADKKVFPNLTTIVIAGHSAGGQVVTRYEMANKVHNTAGVHITYVVANPSSYAWPASVRPLATGDATVEDAYKEALGDNGEKLHTNFTYGAFDSTKAPTFDRWPAGMQGLSGYVANMTADQLRKQLVERPTTYLLGHVDVLPLGGFDSSPTAMAQGPTRRARGEAFFKYVTETMGAKHSVIIVSECGHNDRCIFTTNSVFASIFPK
ncbi:MAG: alpha/beta hydrolase [Gemmatimonas sp.]